MICLDSSVLVEYLEGNESVKAALEEYADRPLFTPTVVCFELYRGATRAGGQEALERVQTGLDWIKPLEFTERTAQEAALIDAELHRAGRPINLGDVLIAAVCRSAGATLLTCDRDFERVDGLEVEYVSVE